MSEKKPPSNVPKTADYEVGYRKPPKKSQFKKGQSGCSQGRPRKTPAMKFDPVFDGYFGDVVLREAMRPVTMRENGQTIEISTLAAIVRRGSGSLASTASTFSRSSIVTSSTSSIKATGTD